MSRQSGASTPASVSMSEPEPSHRRRPSLKVTASVLAAAMPTVASLAPSGTSREQPEGALHRVGNSLRGLTRGDRRSIGVGGAVNDGDEERGDNRHDDDGHRQFDEREGAGLE
jgi:hypothetical protein